MGMLESIAGRLNRMQMKALGKVIEVSGLKLRQEPAA